MKRGFGILLACSVLATGALASDGVRWAKSYGLALDTARKTKRVIMIDFYADW